MKDRSEARSETRRAMVDPKRLEGVVERFEGRRVLAYGDLVLDEFVFALSYG